MLSNLVVDFHTASISEVSGISYKTCIVGKGIVEYTNIDYCNMVQFIHNTAYYVPDAYIYRFNIKTYFQEDHNKGQCVIKVTKATLDLLDGSTLDFPYNK